MAPSKIFILYVKCMQPYTKSFLVSWKSKINTVLNLIIRKRGRKYEKRTIMKTYRWKLIFDPGVKSLLTFLQSLTKQVILYNNILNSHNTSFTFTFVNITNMATVNCHPTTIINDNCISKCRHALSPFIASAIPMRVWTIRGISF